MNRKRPETNLTVAMGKDVLLGSNSAPLERTSPGRKNPISIRRFDSPTTESYRYLSDDEDLSSSLNLSSADFHSVDSGLNSGGRKRIAPPRKRGSIDSLRSNARSEEVTILSSKHKTKRRLLEATADFTINKLNLSIDLVGRDEEISSLRSCFYRLSKQDTGPILRRSFDAVYNELVFISGTSGIGKSALARTIQKDVAKLSSGTFVEGKYEFTTMDVPFSGISQAFGVLCNTIKGNETNNAAIATAINENMKEEAKMLMELIPELHGLLDDDEIEHTSVGVGSASFDNRQDQWNHAFRVFTRTLGSYFNEMVLVLDDLQWADDASLDIIQCLIADIQNPNPLMIVGCYRSNEVNETSSLYRRIQTFRDISEPFAFRITDIEVKSCSIDAVNKMIMSMMSIDDSQLTRELARVCFERTMGNPFFLIEFMTMLQSEGLLEFQIGAMKWCWDVSKIEDVTMSTENVVNLVQARMRKLPDDVQLLLQYAACLGSSFSLSTLELVWKQNECRLTENECNEIPDLLSFVQEAKLIESAGTNQVRWVHDKIQEAALSLSDLVTPLFQFRLGLCLYQSLDKMVLEYLLFEVVDLINKEPAQERADLAVLNLRAAKKARSISAFQSAFLYAAHGINLLPSDPWDVHRRLTLQLYCLGTEMAHAIGQVAVVEEYVNTVLKNEPSISVDTMAIHMTKIRSLASTRLRFSEAIDLGSAVLKELGVNLAWNRRLLPLQALTFCTRTIKKIRSLSNGIHHFDKMERMQDTKQRAIVNLLSNVYYSSYNANNLPLCMLCTCKMIELMLHHGIHEHSGTNLAALSVFVHILQKDHATTDRFAKMAFALNKRYGSGSRVAETTFCLYVFSMPYIVPLHSCLAPLLNGYTKGIKMGDNEPALWCLLIHFVSLPVMMGKPLGSIHEECEKVALQIEEASLKGHSLVLKIMWQLVSNLQMVPNDTSRKLTGDLYCQETDDVDHAPHLGTVHFAQNQLRLYFGDYEAVAKSDIEKGDFYAECMPGNSFIPLETFHRGVAAYAMARRTRNRKYKFRANRLRKMVAKFAKAGNPNVVHYDLMLRAEQAALDRRHSRANVLYKEAIVHAARTGCLHHAALFNERYADYRLHDHDDVDDAKYLMTEAARFYTEWGADGKAEQLKKEVSMLM